MKNSHDASRPPARDPARDSAWDPSWEDLFNRFADGLATADDARQLHDLLAASPDARRAYREFTSLHAALHWDYASVANHAMPPADVPAAGGPRQASRSRWIATFLAGAILSGAAAAVAVAVFRPAQPPVPPQVAPEPARPAEVAATTAADAAPASPAPLARVTNCRFVAAATPARPITPGMAIEAGRIGILGGGLELTLRNGVEILLEGPGELELIDDMTAVLHGGSAVVRMPKGMHGFRLGTPSTEVLDLGTEFAVKVGPDFVTDVQVYDGAVMAAALQGDAGGRFPKRLEAGQAARFSARSPDAPRELPYQEDRFVRRLPTDKGIEHRVGGTSPEAIAAQVTQQFGRPQAEAIVMIRPAGLITIDGRLDEWDSAPGVTASLGLDPAAAEWMDGRMMYDDTHLYIAARVGDPHPLASTVDPNLDADDGWRGGAVQVRLSTDRRLGWPVNASAANYYRMRNIEPTADEREASLNPRLAHLTMWFHAATATPCLTIRHGMLTGDLEPNPSGFRGSYARAADGKGYTMEYAIPWRLLNCESDPPQPGDNLAASWQVLYSDQGGRLFRTQILEVRNPEEPPRIYTWERSATWGRAEYR
ncbi:MAG: hypothetical protein ACKOWG_11375 [Planctomycetia bacterium]